MSSQQSSKPIGQLGVPAMLCGIAGAVLGIVLDAIGIFTELGETLKASYQEKPFQMGDATQWSSAWDWLLAIVLSIGVAYAVLDSKGNWRRVLILVFVLVLISLTSPVLVLWEIFWVPVLLIFAVVWSWLGAFVYAGQHQMPCDFVTVAVAEAQPEPSEAPVEFEATAPVVQSPSVEEFELLEAQKEEIINEDKFKPKANA